MSYLNFNYFISEVLIELFSFYFRKIVPRNVEVFENGLWRYSIKWNEIYKRIYSIGGAGIVIKLIII